MVPGWLKLHRKILESQVFSDAELLRLWCYVLLRASFKTSWFRGVEIKRGEFAFSYRVLSDALGCSRGKLERNMKKLEAMGSIRIKAGRDFSVATVCNYETYQSDDVPSWDANEAANGAVSRDPGGAVNGAVYKKERIREPPPPTPSHDAAARTAAWERVEVGLRNAGVSAAPQTVREAQERGSTPDDVQRRLDEFHRAPGKWGPGALQRVASGTLESWPPPDPAFERGRASASSTKVVNEVKADNANRRELIRAVDERFAELSRAHGPTIDAMDEASLRELFQVAFGVDAEFE